jgi:glycosyltransferase involved in cell wall biosynthesis
MRILYLSQYFPPEAGATQTRAYEMARNWVRLGHRVTMLTEIPNHPAGIILPAYRGKLVERADLEGIDVIRVWVKASPLKSLPNRMLFYISFMVNAMLAGLLLARGRYDLIYATSPPLFVGGAALGLSYLRRIPLAFEVRDLWPESAVALGEISSRRAIAWATRLEEACYLRARAIVVVTQGIQHRLTERGVPAEKVHLIPNGANVELFRFRSHGRERVRSELGLGNKFLAIYAGIHGVAQGLETVVEAARQLQDSLHIHFLLVGDGPTKAALTELAAQYSLTNATFLPEQPRERIPDYLSAADVALIPLRDIPLFQGARPSKMFDAWACERPLLLTIDGEARQIMEKAGGGVFAPPECAAEMAETVLDMASAPAEREAMGARGRAFTEAHFSRQALAEQLIILLKELI